MKVVLDVVILAAGAGTRMQSALPKVLHALAGRPLLAHVIATARQLAPNRLCVVIGHGADTVAQKMAAPDLHFVPQAPQLGTGHAVLQALPQLSTVADALTLVLYGDVPLISVDTLQRLLDSAGADKLSLLTAHLADATGYGRIVRQAGSIQRIVEQKDASPAELAITEINTGILIAPTAHLRRWLAALSNHNAQREYYLTDIVAQAVAEGVEVVASQPQRESEIFGVNSKQQLAQLERLYQHDYATQLLQQGVTLADPARLDVRGTLRCARDVSIDVNCVFEGDVELGAGVTIGANCILINTQVAAGAQIRPFCHLEGARVGADAVIGPYARLRPGTVLAEQVHVGNFVEIKNSSVAAHSKANHLAYLGDATIGARVNIGAGTITCNYDGANKFQTVIEDDVFIGSDTQLIAPVRVGAGATLGAGTTLSSDAPAGKLTVARSRQQVIEGWQRPVKTPK